jgi:hypothetical protein
MNKEAQGKFAATLRKFRDTNAYCNTFGRLWGVFDALDESWCDFYLEVLVHVVKAPVTHPTEEIVLASKLSQAINVSGVARTGGGEAARSCLRVQRRALCVYVSLCEWGARV